MSEIYLIARLMCRQWNEIWHVKYVELWAERIHLKLNYKKYEQHKAVTKAVIKNLHFWFPKCCFDRVFLQVYMTLPELPNLHLFKASIWFVNSNGHSVFNFPLQTAVPVSTSEWEKSSKCCQIISQILLFESCCLFKGCRAELLDCCRKTHTVSGKVRYFHNDSHMCSWYWE